MPQQDVACTFLWVRSSFGQQLLNQLVQRYKVRLTHILLDDLTAFVHQIGGRRELHVAPSLGDCTRVVYRHLERQLARFLIVDDIAGRVVAHGYSHGVVSLSLVFVVGRDDLGHFCDAGHAAGSPKVDQGDFALHVRCGLLAAVKQHKG